MGGWVGLYGRLWVRWGNHSHFHPIALFVILNAAKDLNLNMSLAQLSEVLLFVILSAAKDLNSSHPQSPARNNLPTAHILTGSDETHHR